MHYIYLTIAIIAEVTGTLALQASASFTKLVPSVIVITGYVIAFYCLSLALRQIPVGIAYAVWAGAGIVLVALFGLLMFGQRLDTPAMIGIGFVVVGVFLLTFVSGSVPEKLH
ncbi:MAG: multidrug efflux SMR transporter [Gammaproteobacteria bacterium]